MLDSVQTLLQLVRRSRLLNPVQLNEIKLSWLSALADARALADRLLQRGWLTPYQAEQLLEGHDDALVIGPYRLLNLVGEGALGQVFRALHADTRSVVALKVLRPELRANPEVLQQFWQEREVLAGLQHPAFVTAFDANPDGAQYYFAMEYVEGIDLGKLLQFAGPLPPAQACDYIRQAALGLQSAYEHGLVHRDVKPSNLLVSFATDQVRILDIGSARREWHDGEGTASGALMGTADYIAPEQIVNSQGADTRADIYSLGCTFYHLLTGRPPFPSGSLARKLFDHQQTPPPSLRQTRPDLPENLEAIVQRMLAKQPADRYQTPALVAVALAPFCQDDAPRLELDRFRPQGNGLTAPLAAAPAEEHADGADAATIVEARPAPQADQPPAARPAFVERRAAPRRARNIIPVLVANPSAALGEQPLLAWVLDRSAGGLGLLIGDPLEIGTVMNVRPDRPDVTDRWIQVRIVYCIPERIRWRVGCQFVQTMTWDVLRTFG